MCRPTRSVYITTAHRKVQHRRVGSNPAKLSRITANKLQDKHGARTRLEGYIYCVCGSGADLCLPPGPSLRSAYCVNSDTHEPWQTSLHPYHVFQIIKTYSALQQ